MKNTAPLPITKSAAHLARHDLCLRLPTKRYDVLREFAFQRAMKHQHVLENALIEYLEKYNDCSEYER